MGRCPLGSGSISPRPPAPGLLRGAFHFTDDGLWRLHVRSGAVDARAEVLVLHSGGLAPAPKGALAPVAGPGGGLGVVGGR